MIHMQVMHDSSEIIYYDVPGLPVRIITEKLSNYPDMRAICHWHEDVELMYIVSGEMNYEINGKTVLLTANSTAFINSRQLHYGFSVGHADCEFICLLFHPSLLHIGDLIYQSSVEPVISSESVEYLLFDGSSSEGKRVALRIREAAELKRCAASGVEWDIVSMIFRIWKEIFCRCEISVDGADTAEYADRQLQRNMVSFIFRHYSEPLTLGMIADSGNVSRSKCCVIFKKYLGQSPIDFVNSYRLEMTRRLLKETTRSVTDIAVSCGFNHSSYYTKIFSRKYGCTPSEYRHTKESRLEP